MPPVGAAVIGPERAAGLTSLQRHKARVASARRTHGWGERKRPVRSLVSMEGARGWHQGQAAPVRPSQGRDLQQIGPESPPGHAEWVPLLATLGGTPTLARGEIQQLGQETRRTRGLRWSADALRRWRKRQF
uniref:Uncharacterized protein n=1 Tax=Sphaerodactylus townsendi TaxID=933632 RepID=A0ACB8EZK5_9SAUR